ncbi:hypothetical protein FACS189449_07170 [Alphaproteobacteria bacterium]|nr:hypothetical protein FACS189449_07170 [Alphaproteobacteria bacterium]
MRHKIRIRLLLVVNADTAQIQISDIEKLKQTAKQFYDRFDVRNKAVSEMQKIMEVNPNLAPQVVSALISCIDCSALGRTVADSLHFIVQQHPNLAVQVINGIAPNFQEGTPKEVNNVSCMLLRHIIERNHDLATQVATLLTPHLKKHYWDGEYYSFMNAGLLVYIIEKHAIQDVAVQNIVAELTIQLGNHEVCVRGNAVNILAALVKANPNLATQTLLNALTPLREDREHYGMYYDCVHNHVSPVLLAIEQARVIETLIATLEENPGSAMEKPVIEKLVAVLTTFLDKSSDVFYKHAIDVLDVKVKEATNIFTPIATALVSCLNCPDDCVRTKAGDFLKALVEKNPDLATQVAALLAPSLKDLTTRLAHFSRDPWHMSPQLVKESR